MAYGKAADRVAEVEDRRAADMRRHIANVKQAQDFLRKIDFVMTSPASGGAHSGMATGMSLSTHRTDTNWFAGAVEDAMASQQTLKSTAESGPER